MRVRRASATARLQCRQVGRRHPSPECSTPDECLHHHAVYDLICGLAREDLRGGLRRQQRSSACSRMQFLAPPCAAGDPSFPIVSGSSGRGELTSKTGFIWEGETRPTSSILRDSSSSSCVGGYPLPISVRAESTSPTTTLGRSFPFPFSILLPGSLFGTKLSSFSSSSSSASDHTAARVKSSSIGDGGREGNGSCFCEPEGTSEAMKRGKGAQEPAG